MLHLRYLQASLGAVHPAPVPALPRPRPRVPGLRRGGRRQRGDAAAAAAPVPLQRQPRV